MLDILMAPRAFLPSTDRRAVGLNFNTCEPMVHEGRSQVSSAWYLVDTETVLVEGVSLPETTYF